MALDPNIGRIKFLRSKTAGLTPTTADIDEGELALNLVDRTIYTRNGNNIIDIGFGKGGQVNGNITASGTVKATKLEGPLTGNAATATSLQTARTINGVSFDGSTNITIADSTKLPLTGGTLTGGLTAPNLTATGSIKAITLYATGAGDYSPSGQGAYLSWNRNVGSGKTDFINNRGGGPGGFDWWNGNESSYTQVMSLDQNGVLNAIGGFSGNAASATKLQTARTIGITGSGVSGSVSFDGTDNINIPLAVTTQASTTNNTTIATTAFVQAVNSADTGSAATALTLKTARTIGGVSFNGSANINLPGVNTAGNQNTSGNAASATKLQTARNINGVPFDGTSNITIADSTKLPLSGGTLTGALNLANGTWNTVGDDSQFGDVDLGGILGIRSNNEAAYVGLGFYMMGANKTAPTALFKVRSNGEADLNVPLNCFSFKGNATSATKLETARTINGVSFDGTANITVADSTKVPLAGGTLTGALNGTTAAFSGSVTVGNGIQSTNAVSFLNDSSAQKINTGGVLVSGSYSDASLVPTYGIYSKGVVYSASGYKTIDYRDAKPNVITGNTFSHYFTTIGGMTGTADTAWADMLVLNGYGDSSGGSVNALVMAKQSANIYHYQAAIGATTWGAARRLAYDSEVVKLTGGTMTGDLAVNALGVNNTASTGGLGLSLYGGVNAGMPGYGLAFSGTPAFGTHGSVVGDWATYFTMSGATNRGWIFKSGNGAGGNVASISAAGAITATSILSSGNITAFSDARLKDNITKIPDALNKLNQLKGVTYTRKDIASDKQYAGLIAQDVQKVLPEAVATTEGDIIAVDYNGVIGLLVEAIKELNNRIDKLERI